MELGNHELFLFLDEVKQFFLGTMILTDSVVRYNVAIILQLQMVIASRLLLEQCLIRCLLMT